MKGRGFLILGGMLLLSGCLSYYQANIHFMQDFESGRMAQAEKHLAKKEDRWLQGRNRLLYHFNMGVVESMQGEYEESNRHFEKAYNITENDRIDYLSEAASFLLNPSLTIYYGEDHEKLYINYYKAFNYLKVNQPQKALVECKRMNIRLNALKGRYKSKRKFREDAFMHLLMGIIYESNREYNDAFIAYRNAYKYYEEEYKPLFGVEAPEQLKKDLIRSAHRTGFKKEARQYEEQFGLSYEPVPKGHGNLVFLWHNGFAPIKDQFTLTFAINRSSGGTVAFVNEQYNLNFTFDMGSRQNVQTKLGDLEFVRVAFPKYIERPPIHSTARLVTQGKEQVLQQVEPINDIAFYVLRQRMLLELGKGLLRFAIKKAAEYGVREQNEAAGAAVGIFNALTEQADTRSWQTLPHSIYYQRMFLPSGEQEVELRLGQGNSQTFQISIAAGQTTYHTHHSLDVRRIGIRRF